MLPHYLISYFTNRCNRQKLLNLTLRKIAESFRRFGISDDSTNILAIKVGAEASQVESHLRQYDEGDSSVFSDEVLAQLCDSARIRKIYRVDMTQKDDPETVRKEAEAFVLGSMALKGS